MTEPAPGAAVPDAAMAGRRTVSFGTPPTTIGGFVHLKFDPDPDPTDLVPINIYAFFVTPPETVPATGILTAEWFFAAHPGATKVSGTWPVVDTSLPITIAVAGVVPGAHHLQVVYEFKN